MCGLDNFVLYDEKVLKPAGLQALKLQDPQHCGGVGGKAEIVISFAVPIAMGDCPCVVATVVVKNRGSVADTCGTYEGAHVQHSAGQ